MEEITVEYTPIPIAHARCQEAFTDLIYAYGGPADLGEVVKELEMYKLWVEMVGTSNRPFEDSSGAKVR